MRLVLAAVARGSASPYASSLETYRTRIARFAQVENTNFRSEAALLSALAKESGRTAPLTVLLDSRGRSFSSTEFAAWLGGQRDAGRQALVFAVGPADGWSETARARADLLLSLGPMTLPHELARLVLTEQVYRAFTILAGHPYHSDH